MPSGPDGTDERVTQPAPPETRLSAWASSLESKLDLKLVRREAEEIVGVREWQAVRVRRLDRLTRMQLLVENGETARTMSAVGAWRGAVLLLLVTSVDDEAWERACSQEDSADLLGEYPVVVVVVDFERSQAVIVRHQGERHRAEYARLKPWARDLLA